jgi:hypothetical protein
VFSVWLEMQAITSALYALLHTILYRMSQLRYMIYIIRDRSVYCFPLSRYHKNRYEGKIRQGCEVRWLSVGQEVCL